MEIFENFIAKLENRFSRFKLSIIIFFIIGVCFYYLLTVSWLRWGDLIVDTSREMWLPSQILQGKVLYKDIFYEYGFFSPYFFALLYKIFGESINALVGSGIAITALMALLLFKISRFFLDEIVSGLVVLTFLYVFAFDFFNSDVFNFILPYSFASIFFILFATLSLFLFLKFIYCENFKYLLLWSISFTLAFFSRFDISLPVFLGFIISGLAFIYSFKEKKLGRPKALLYLISPLFISAIGYFIFLSKTQAFAAFKEIFVGFKKGFLANDFRSLQVAGLDDISGNIFLIFKSLFFHMLAISLLGWVSVNISSYFLGKKKNNPSLIFSIFLGFLISALMPRYLGGLLQYKCLALILIIGIILYFVKIKHTASKEDFALFVLFLISLSLALRIILNTTIRGIGFFLLSSGLACYYIFFFKIVKEFFQKHFRNFSGTLYSAILIIFFIPLISVCWSWYQYNYFRKDLEVITSKGKLYCWPDLRTKRFWQAIDYLKVNTSKNDKLVVFPQGVSINFFSQRETPLKYYVFDPSIIEMFGEEKIIAESISSNIDYIAIVHRPTLEYGYPFFGVHYAKKLNSWIFENYKVVKQFGPMPFTSDEFGIAILKKK